jgi:hypothetical protein
MRSGITTANQFVLIEKNTLMLLIWIFCLGCLGALPISSYLLSSLHKTPLSSPVKRYPDGQCGTTVQTAISPTPTTLSGKLTPKAPVSQGKPTQTTLPSEWSKVGLSQQDFVNAQACATAFVQNYQSFDYRNLNTLQSAIFMLSSAAKKRFYEGSGSVSANLRLDKQWQIKVQARRMVQTAQPSQPTMLNSKYIGKTLYVTFDVPYQLIAQIDGHSTALNYHEIVLLKSIASNAHLQGTSWQVSDYRDSNQ